MKHSIVEEVFASIINRNAKDNLDAIPHSDVFFKEMQATFGLDDESLRGVLNILKDAHKILIMQIAKEDEFNKLPSVEGYVDADLTTLRRLKNFFHGILEESYEKDYGKRMGAHQIIRTMLPQMSMINHSIIGTVVNKAVMLEEFEKLVEKHYMEYNEQWKDSKLAELLEERSDLINSIAGKKKSKVAEENKVRRAVDSEACKNFDNTRSNQSLEKVLSIYGVDFFFRVTLRRYEFDTLLNIVKSGKLKRKMELRKLKEMIQKIKLNMEIDTGLQTRIEELQMLDRAVSRAIHFCKE